MSTVIGSFVEESLEIARRAIHQYDFSPQATLDVVNLSENVTFRIEDPATGEVAAMRLHRTDYHTVTQIKSELLWLDALASSRCVEVPPPFPTLTGERVARIDTLDGDRLVTVAGWLDGAMPDENSADLPAAFEMLGAATAKLHDHAQSWTLPPGFCRRPWGVEQLLGSRPTFGPWREGLGLGPEELAILEATEAAIRSDLASFDQGPGTYGLVHADLRLANLLLDDRDGREIVRVIDFDDCGPSWFMYDFGSAVSFME
ncbi:MAG: phosphotransferase, partial [Solirubrobacteraceae bacterium]|nr:phosphotransferase [Solirubrobacteraceae bacterium]